MVAIVRPIDSLFDLTFFYFMSLVPRPIHDAAEAGHVNVIRVLLSFGADPFLVTYAGLNAMACAKHPVIKGFLQGYLQLAFFIMTSHQNKSIV